MRKLLVLFTVLFTIMLVGCSFNFADKDVEEKEVSAVETSDDKEVDNDEVIEEEEEEKEETTEIEKVLVDNKHLKATMKNIVKVTNERWDEERYEINIEIENKRDDTIEVTAREVSADDVMIDKMVFFSETVASGKTAHGQMAIENFDGPLPDMKENLEFILHIYSHDDFDFEDNHEIKIEF